MDQAVSNLTPFSNIYDELARVTGLPRNVVKIGFIKMSYRAGPDRNPEWEQVREALYQLYHAHKEEVE